jgi:hypothetical protein
MAVETPAKEVWPIYNLFTARRDRQLWGAPVVEEVHADSVAAWFRARDAAWVYPDILETAEIDTVNPRAENNSGLFAKNVPADTDSMYRLHNIEGALQCALGGDERHVSDTGLSAVDDEYGHHLDGFEIYAHRDTLRARRPKVNADEMRRLRGSIRARFKGDPKGFVSLFDPVEVEARLLVPSDGAARVRCRPPGCRARLTDDGSIVLELLDRERYPQSYTIDVTVNAGQEDEVAYKFSLKASRKKPLPDPEWKGRSMVQLEILARCAELWIEPSGLEPEPEADVFDLIDLLDVDMVLAA